MVLLLASFAFGYPPVDGIPFATREEQVFGSSPNQTRFELSRQQNSEYSDALIAQAIEASSRLSMIAIFKADPNRRQCSVGDTVELYEVSVGTLNDPSRFPAKFMADYAEGRGPLWGFYDPRAAESRIDSIVVSSHGLSEDYHILVHEMAHYWYAVYCMNYVGQQTSEQFAEMIADQTSWSAQ